MSKRFLITIITLAVIAFSAGIAIFLAKGYTFSPTEKRIVGTGIINITSEPDAASVFIDGHLTTATNATVSSLSPKSYTVRVVKEGFIPWERLVEVKEGVVTAVKVTLFPAIPTIYPLTFSGVLNPSLSPDGSKLAYIVPANNNNLKKAGVWVWTMVRNQPIAFARSSEPHQIASNTTTDFSKATLKWSPDSKQVLAVTPTATVDGNNYLLESESMNNDPRDITPILSATLSAWEEDIESKEMARVMTINDDRLRKIASDSASLSWAPDETKFMASSSAEVKVYDLEDNERSSSVSKDYKLPKALAYIWLPDSRHIVLVEEGAISMVDFDGTNKAVIYVGKFEDSFVFPWPDSSRFVIISSFPTPTASEPNLYGINLR
ncbi:PEGA domain-containing protein [Candidatus Daviesbacteria bacterium]|nr:PEGA domain-containing protein [Candidatus Daviesbacteria bacterium]